jgi:hypothetical protein
LNCKLEKCGDLVGGEKYFLPKKPLFTSGSSNITFSGPLVIVKVLY